MERKLLKQQAGSALSAENSILECIRWARPLAPTFSPVPSESYCTLPTFGPCGLPYKSRVYPRFKCTL